MGLSLALLGTACTHYAPMQVSTSPVGSGNEVPVKVATGESTASVLFGFVVLSGNDSLSAALQDALEGTEADTMMNVFVDRQAFCVPACWFPLYLRTTTQVFGTLVRYEGASAFESNIESRLAAEKAAAEAAQRVVHERQATYRSRAQKCAQMSKRRRPACMRRQNEKYPDLKEDVED
ncbi:MAG TPA: hypothetical protein EYQ60_11310 [Myxococcales bacterium]|nr:hypothetical protein [Myxococcales bacterium]